MKNIDYKNTSKITTSNPNFKELGIENNIIARDKYIEQIFEEFDNVLLGKMGLSIITGKAGVGKTYLVESTEDLFSSNNCTYVKVKFKQYNQDDLTVIIDIIDQIIKHILILPQDAFKLVQNNLNESFSSNSEIIMSLCPYAIKIFGNKGRNPLMEINDKHENKIIEATYHFIEIVSKLLFPLVIFIDDLQWADKLSLNIIDCICDKESKINMYLILACRENEMLKVNTKLFSDNLEKTIKLYELNRTNTLEYVISVFGNNINNIDYLTNVTYSLSRGNPFYLSLITNEIFKRNILVKEADGWILDSKKIRNLAISKDIEAVISNQVDSLDDTDRKILELISCFGGCIKYDILKALVNTTINNLDAHILKLSSGSLLIKEKDNYNIVHDIIYRIIYQRQNKKLQLEMYYYIANTLKEYGSGNYAEDNTLFIASFLIKTDRSFLEKESTKWIDHLYNAAIIARERTAFDTALKICRLCDYLISIDPNSITRELYLNIQLEYMQCQFISGKELEAKERYELLIKKFSDKDNLIKIKLKYINFYSYSANWEKVISLGIEILNNLKYGFDTRFIFFNLLKSRMLYSSKNIEEIKHAPHITDKRILAILEVLTIMFPATNRIDSKKFTLVTLKLAILSKKYGKSIYSCIGYAAYCYVLFIIIKDYERGDRLQQITMDLLDDKENKWEKSIPYALLGTFTYYWTNSLCSTMECLNKSIVSGEEEGEYLYSNYAIVFSIITKYVMGEELSSIVSFINHSKTRKKRLENYLTYHMYEVYLSHISLLKNGYGNNGYRLDENKQSFYDTIVLNEKMIKLHRLYLENKLKDAYDLAKEIESLVWKHQGFVLNTDFAFYSILSRIGVHNTLPKKEKKHNRKIIERDRKKIKKWADVNKNNYYPRYLLVQAEYDDYILKIKHKKDYYNKAMTLAEKENNIQIEALANFLASKHYKYNQKLSQFYAKESSRLYKKWGADYIANLIYADEAMEESIEIINDSKVFQRDRKKSGDVKILENLSKPENQTYSYILNYIVDKFNIQYGLILVERKGEMLIKYEKKYHEKVRTYNEPINMNYIHFLSHKIIRYVARSEEDVNTESNTNIDFLGSDLQFLEARDMSIICIPIKQYDILIGMVYLEKSSAIQADENIVDIIKWLVSLIPKKAKVYSKKDINKNDIMLTSRETQILNLINMGMSNLKISEKLFISVGTVRNHLSKVYFKLQVDNRVQAIIKAKEKHII